MLTREQWGANKGFQSWEQRGQICIFESSLWLQIGEERGLRQDLSQVTGLKIVSVIQNGHEGGQSKALEVERKRSGGTLIWGLWND